MQENLVIVESPAKAKTIEKFLGKDFIVKSSFGHIRDLAKKDLGINIAEGFKPVYEIPSDKKKVVDELTKLAKEKTVWLASDEDREGEAIAWHLTEVLGLPVDQTKRIVFHEITKRAILEAIEKPRTVNMDLVNAQQARRILDRLVGIAAKTHLHIALPADEPDVADEDVGQLQPFPAALHRQRPGLVSGFGCPQAHRPAAPGVGDGFGPHFRPARPDAHPGAGTGLSP